VIWNCCWNIYSRVNWHLISNFLTFNQKQICSIRCPCCNHVTSFSVVGTWEYIGEQGVLLWHVHRASVAEKMSPEELKYPGFTVPHDQWYMYLWTGKSLWNNFTAGWKKEEKTWFWSSWITNLTHNSFFLYLFIPNLYTFRAAMCSSSGECTVSIWPLVYVTLCRWPYGMQAAWNM